MSPAETVIQRFGGVRSLARDLGIDHSSVARWPMPKARRGSAGNIPSKYHATILRTAERRGIALSAAELIFGTPRTDLK